MSVLFFVDKLTSSQVNMSKRKRVRQGTFVNKCTYPQVKWRNNFAP